MPELLDDGPSGVPFLTLPGGRAPAPDRRELLARASALVPALRRRAAWAQEHRRLPDETVDELHATGLLALMRPAADGGHEVDLQTLNAVIGVVAQGCASTAWVVATLAVGSFIAGSALPAAGREEVARSRAPVCSAFSCRAGGTARRVPGGYRIEHGEWPWASGSQMAGWSVLRATLVDDDGTPVDNLLVAVPMDDVEVLDEWHTTAMRGTASNVIALRDAFVPEHRAGAVSRVLAGEHLAAVAPAFRTPWVQTVYLALAPVAIGLARHALELFIERASGKPLANTSHNDLAALDRTHVLVGASAARIDAAALVLNRAGAGLDRWGEAGAVPPIADRLRTRADLSMIVRLCTDVVHELYENIGASAIMERDPFATVARDIDAVVMHAANNPASNFDLYGAALLGKEPAVVRFGPTAMT